MRCSPNRRSTKRSASDGLDPAPAHRLGDLPVGADERLADAVHHVVDVADDDRDQRVELAEELLLLGRPAGPEEHLGIGEQLLHALQVADRRRIELEVGHALLERPGVGPEAGHELLDERLEPAPHVGHAEHGVVGDLVEADPQPQVVGRRGSTPRRTRRWSARPA